MNTKLYVGNLSPEVTETILRDLFAQKGPVAEVKLMTDRATGSFRGFAYVTMKTPEAATAAMQALHSHPLGGRYITVNESRQEEVPTVGLIGSSTPMKRGL
jgi:RNA recognition motif-containing protein